jgi:hypothetical protein
LFNALAVVMVIPVLVLIEFLFRPTFAKRVLAFGAIPSAKKFTFGEMRAVGVRGVLIYCRDYRCSQWTRLDADRWSDGARLSDVETGLVCTACGKRGADVRPDFNWARKSVEMMGYREEMKSAGPKPRSGMQMPCFTESIKVSPKALRERH